MGMKRMNAALNGLGLPTGLRKRKSTVRYASKSRFFRARFSCTCTCTKKSQLGFRRYLRRESTILFSPATANISLFTFKDNGIYATL